MKIKIFLASSIKEFGNDRMNFAIYLNKLNSIFNENYGISIFPFICETADHFVSKNERKQDDYNDAITNSDVVIFLIGEHLGRYTKEEFDFSCKKFKENSNPKIYVYFHEKSRSNEDINDFKMLLEDTYHHYYDTFEYIDTVKFCTLLNLRHLFLPLMKIEIRNNCFFIDGKKVEEEILSPSKIHAFSNNEQIKTLSQKYDSAEDDEKKVLLRMMNKVYNEILSVFLGASAYISNGEYNSRYIEAMCLLEKGDKLGAISALDNDHIEDILEVEERKLKNKVMDVIGGLALEINIRKIDASKEKDYDTINSLYLKSIKYAIQYVTGLKILNDYALWLNSIHKVRKAIEIAEKLNSIIIHCSQQQLQENNISYLDLANFKMLLGVLYRKTSKFKEAYSAYCEAFSYWSDCIDLFKENQLWTFAEYIEEVACFIQIVPNSISDIVNPMNYKTGVCVGQLATEIMRLKNILQDRYQLDFSTLESNPFYISKMQSIMIFEKSLTEEEKQILMPNSLMSVFDNPIYESYVLFLIVLCIKQSVIIKTNRYEEYAKGMAMTILNIATIQNMLHDFKSAEEGANLSLEYLKTLIKLDSKIDINEDMIQAYGVLYTSHINRYNNDKAQEYRNQMLLYGEKAYKERPREFSLIYADMLFQLGIDCLQSFNFSKSIEVFDKIINLNENIKKSYKFDRAQYLIPFFLSYIKWIEAYTLNQTDSTINKDYDMLFFRFKQAKNLVDEIIKTKTYSKETKANCVLELNWCNLLYLPPIQDKDACILIMDDMMRECLILSGDDISKAYDQWKKSFDVITNVNNVMCSFNDCETEKKDWLKKYYSIYEIPLNFIIKNSFLYPSSLIPPHFRYLPDYACFNNPNDNFLENYNTLLFIIYNNFISEDNEEDIKYRLIEKIKETYDKLIDVVNLLENQFYLMKILEKERNQIKFE